MEILDLSEIISDISFNHLDFQSFRIGDRWDQSVTKGDGYPAIWFETPILTEYRLANKSHKIFTFALDILMLPKLDDLESELTEISKAEVLADKLVWYLHKCKSFSVTSVTGLTIKAYNADVACGIRLDIRIESSRVCVDLNCEYKEPCLIDGK